MFIFNFRYWLLEYNAELTTDNIVLILSEIQCYWRNFFFQCHNSSFVRNHIFEKGLEVVPGSIRAFETYLYFIQILLSYQEWL